MIYNPVPIYGIGQGIVIAKLMTYSEYVNLLHLANNVQKRTYDIHLNLSDAELMIFDLICRFHDAEFHSRCRRGVVPVPNSRNAIARFKTY